MLFGRSEFIPEGVGISPDTPRKKGLARLVEIMSRDLDGIFLSGSLALLACAPVKALFQAIFFSFFINLHSPFCKNGRPDRGGHFCNGGIFSARTRRG